MIKLFPDVNPQTLFNHMRAILKLPGKQLYFDKLVDAWYDVYQEFVGTADLQDDHRDSATDFDLIKHVEFLRRKVNKFTL
jgi:hypothetical protein